jgi:hypothetical protein
MIGDGEGMIIGTLSLTSYVFTQLLRLLQAGDDFLRGGGKAWEVGLGGVEMRRSIGSG